MGEYKGDSKLSIDFLGEDMVRRGRRRSTRRTMHQRRCDYCMSEAKGCEYTLPGKDKDGSKSASRDSIIMPTCLEKTSGP